MLQSMGSQGVRQDLVTKQQLYAAHKDIDPKSVRTRRLMLATPDYLTTNQSEKCPQANHTLCNAFPHPVFKNLVLKVMGRLGLSNIRYLDSLLGTLQ